MTIAQIACHYGCLATYEVNQRTWKAQRIEYLWTQVSGPIDSAVILGLERKYVRNVTLQLRELDSLSEEEKANAFTAAWGDQHGIVHSQPNEDGIELWAQSPRGTIYLNVWSDGQICASYKDHGEAAINASALLSYLRSIHVRVEGKEVVNG